MSQRPPQARRVEPRGVPVCGLGRSRSEPLGAGARQDPQRRDAAGRRSATPSRHAGRRHALDRPRTRSRGPDGGARPGTGDDPPAEPHGVQQHDPRSAWRRSQSGRRLSAGRLGLRLRQHRRRAVGVAGADGAVPAGIRTRRADGGVWPRAAQADARAQERRSPQDRGVDGGAGRRTIRPA